MAITVKSSIPHGEHPADGRVPERVQAHVPVAIPALFSARRKVCATPLTVYERLGPGLLHELERKTPKDDNGRRPNKFHQWLTEDIGDPMLAQHLHTVIMFQRLAIANGYGWHRFVKAVDQVLPKRGTTMELPLGHAWEHDGEA